MTAQPHDGLTERTVTVLMAAAANMAVATAKVVAGLVSGSAAMQAEAAHSVADTITEVFLFVAARRGGRNPDRRHPLGHGRETYLWAFLAAVTTFVVGAGFALLRGVDIVLHGERMDANATVPLVVVLVAFILESGSLRRAVRHGRVGAERARMRLPTYLRVTSDTTLKAVILEDAAALVGLLVAAAGLALWHVTGNPTWDGLASGVIGLLLVIVAVTLAVTNVSLLAGQAAGDELQAALRAEVESLEEVETVPVFMALVLGPGELLVAAKVHFVGHWSAADIERVADEAEERLRARFPAVSYVFLDPTRPYGAELQPESFHEVTG